MISFLVPTIGPQIQIICATIPPPPPPPLPPSRLLTVFFTFGSVLYATVNTRGMVGYLQLLAKEPTTKDPKAVIEKNQAVRSNLRALEENWKELDSAYQTEKNKRRVSA